MSLIHDALKKAQEKEKPTIGSGLVAMGDEVGNVKKGIPRRTLVLIVILVLSLALFAYMKLSPSSKPGVAVPQPSAAGGAAPVAGGAGELKKKAYDAFRSGDFDMAWSGFSAASELAPADPEIWNNLGLTARRRGDIEAARKNYEKALGFKPDYPEVMNNIAMLEMERGNNTKAAEYLERALKISPAYPEANFNLALLYEKKGDEKKAFEYYKRFLEVGGNFPGNVVDGVRNHVMEIEP